METESSAACSSIPLITPLFNSYSPFLFPLLLYWVTLVSEVERYYNGFVFCKT